MLARHPLQVEMAQALGANRVLRGETAGDAAVQVAGAKKYKPIKGKPTYAGGFDWVYDCVGSNASVDDSLRVAGPHGHVIMVGCAAEMSHLDLTFLWNRELQVSGCYVYGRENTMEGKPHTFRVAMEMINGHPGVDLTRLITHKFRLDQWQEAMQVSLARGKHGAIKTVFDSAIDPLKQSSTRRCAVLNREGTAFSRSSLNLAAMECLTIEPGAASSALVTHLESDLTPYLDSSALLGTSACCVMFPLSMAS